MFELGPVAQLPNAHFSSLPSITLQGAVDFSAPAFADSDTLVLALGEVSEQPPALLQTTGDHYGFDLVELATRQEFTAKAAQVATLELPRPTAPDQSGARRRGPLTIVLLGLGEESAALRIAGAKLAKKLPGKGRVLVLGAEALTAERFGQLVQGYLLGAYHLPRFSSTAPEATQSVPGLTFALPDPVPLAATLREAQVAAAATRLVRDLAAVPANFKNPLWFAEVATALAAEQGLQVRRHGEAELQELGAGGLLAVSAASQHPPQLVIIDYLGQPDAAPTPKVAIVGKGITYDTGGLSLKPREAMVGMKTDMAGAAVALASVLAAAHLGLKPAVRACLALAENHLGSASYRPGDVITVPGGKRVEIANTDAEGRLVLADALSLLRDDPELDYLIDVATLTGAATLGLGRQHGALYATDPQLAQALVRSGSASGEEVWQLPLVAAYRAALDSQVADIRHVTLDPTVSAGSVTAALFLQEFVGQQRWAHLDIAGVGRATADSALSPAGPTGYGARLLVDFLSSL